VGSVKLIVVLPAATPVTEPLAEPTVAMAVLLLLHVPPVLVVVSVVLLALHRVLAPVILAGLVLTVNNAVVKQPVGRV
jgi:hypothetical protein